jgi:hypothetical protein
MRSVEAKQRKKHKAVKLMASAYHSNSNPVWTELWVTKKKKKLSKKNCVRP